MLYKILISKLKEKVTLIENNNLTIYLPLIILRFLYFFMKLCLTIYDIITDS